MHEGVTGFLGGRLTFAELGNPKRILEVGYVSPGASYCLCFLKGTFDQGGKRGLGNTCREGLP